MPAKQPTLKDFKVEITRILPTLAAMVETPVIIDAKDQLGTEEGRLELAQKAGQYEVIRWMRWAIGEEEKGKQLEDQSFPAGGAPASA